MAIKPEDKNGVQQIVFYSAGLGGSGQNDNHMLAGLFGAGIDKHIKDLYTFLLMNYDEGDEVYMFGFSRGSYTVRSLAGLIRHSGLGRRDQLRFVDEAYESYRSKKSPTLPDMKDFRRIPIILLACFDTVGALGIPGIIGTLDGERYAFHNTTLSGDIQNAVHILSIDEHLEAFKPTLMVPSSAERTHQLTQLYFPGGHGGVGGGNLAELKLSQSTLRFLVEEMGRRQLGLELNMSMIPTANVDVPPTPRNFGALDLLGEYVRPISSLAECHLPYVVQRYHLQETWRAPALKKFDKALSAMKIPVLE